MKILNVARNFLRPAYRAEMTRKIVRRLFGRRSDERAHAESRDWCAAATEDLEAFARARDSALWDEAQTFAHALEEGGAQTLASLPVKLGGGGAYALLYFLTRLRKPEIVVETGVAAGFSSTAFLKALRVNGRGHLYSSDLPYFRLENPERFVGIVVPPELREGWSLYLEGDRRNLESILSVAPRIDLFHYDSDKSVEGRALAMAMVESRLAPHSIVVMDDIDDNLFFRDYVTRANKPYRVFFHRGRYVGVLGTN